VKISWLDYLYAGWLRFAESVKSDDPKMTAKMFLAACLAITFLAIVQFIEYYKFVPKDFIFQTKWHSLYVSIPLIIFSILYYSKEKIETIKNSLNERSKKYIKINITVSLCSFFIPLALNIILSKK
jgi:preprotein translocase subunit Sec61beta